MLSWAFGLLQAVQTEGESQLRGFLEQALTFLYTVAHWLGRLVIDLVRMILGDAMPTGILEDVVDPLGFLILITLFLAVAEVTKRIAWLVVVVGWALIAARIAIELI